MKRVIDLSIQVAIAALPVVDLLTTTLVTRLSVRTVTTTKPAHVLRPEASLAEHYLDVMKRHLTRSDYEVSSEEQIPVAIRSSKPEV